VKITAVHARTFRYLSDEVRDSDGHGHPGPRHEASESLLTIETDEGVEGYAFGRVSREALEELVRPALLGSDPDCRERMWQAMRKRQRMNLSVFGDRVLSVVDCALWDLAGRAAGKPVYRLLGAARDKVPAYASTMCGDDLPDGLGSPEAYAAFALKCRERGYPAFKLHTWQPPYAGAPDTRRDIAACAAVREALGPGVPLMLDPWHYYGRDEALTLARALEKLEYTWMEEPMDEHSISSYVWLCANTSLPICGPETAEGKMHVRAEWIAAGACDIVRAGVGDVGGITPLLKIAHLAEAFGMDMEVHGGGAANLQALCAMGIPGRFYERGLLHPAIDYEKPRPWLRRLVDPMDAEGFVHVSELPGLGMDIDFDCIRGSEIERY
jgi:L-alanine-DL-glutamate epimerase-like enolase superfamily enzyme